jgi:hypothetical protein
VSHFDKRYPGDPPASHPQGGDALWTLRLVRAILWPLELVGRLVTWGRRR